MPKFSADPTSGAAPLNVNFAVDRSAGYCLTHQWNFGDPASGDRNSATTSGQSGPVHVYKQAGSYHVVLNLSNSAGQTYADTTITVTGGSGSGGPPSGDTPYITAGLDPNPDYSGVDVSGSKFTPNTQVHINVTKKSDKSLLASGSVPADDLGTFSKQFINVPSCTGSGSTEFTIVVQATDYSGALSNPVEVSCYTTGSP
jgi:PKD repeat protein